VTVTLLQKLQELQNEDRTVEASVEFPRGWRVPTSNRRRKELDMWQKWKSGGESPEDMEPLLESIQPIINANIKKYTRGTPIRREAVRAHARNLAISALERYDPSKAQMHTFLYSHLKGLDRYTKQNQNIQRVTESRLRLVGPLQRARAELEDRFDREPTTQELATHISAPVKQVILLQQELKEDNLASLSADPDVFLDETPLSRIKLQLLYFELSPDEKLVYEYITGYGGKPKIQQPGDIALKLGWSGSKVSQVKKAIAKRLSKYDHG